MRWLRVRGEDAPVGKTRSTGLAELVRRALPGARPGGPGQLGIGPTEHRPITAERAYALGKRYPPRRRRIGRVRAVVGAWDAVELERRHRVRIRRVQELDCSGADHRYSVISRAFLLRTESRSR